MSLKDRDPSAATDHHRKVKRVSPWVLNLSLNVLEGRRCIRSNRSSLQSRNSFSFASRPVHQFVWRTHICLQQQIIITNYKHFLLCFSTCPSICFKDWHLFAATDHHRKVETFSPSVLDVSINFLKGHTSISGKTSWSESRNSFLFPSGYISPFPWRICMFFQQHIIMAN